jgi:hypothetical protein
MAAGDPGSPARYYSSIAVETALSGSIPAQAQGAANTAFIVASVSGFPSSYPYTLIVDPDTSKEEVVTVVAGSGTTLSVTRGSDNTQGVAHSAGAVVRHGVSGREFRESETHIAARGFDIDQTILDLANQTHVHGIVTNEGVVVGTLKEQTLTRKTLTTPIINGATISGAVTSTATVTGGTFTSVTVTSSTISTSTLTGSFTASAATFVSPTISGSPVITGLSSAGMVDSSATPKIYVDAILGSATAAATSAASAAVSATSAATSATSAASSATASASSASASATSASAAATSATSAAASVTAAATSATSAAASQTAAATSATSAAASAVASATSASAAATSAASAATSATSAAASYDSFDDRYLGAKATPPTVDNDGNALLTGALYWNTSVNKMYVWSGTAWGEISSSAEMIAYKYTVTGGATSVSGADDNGLTLTYTVGKEQVYINGVLQVRGSDYTATTGSSITGISAMLASDIVTVLAFTAFSISNTYTQAEADAKFFQNANAFVAGKNKIINGDFGINQRAFTSVTATSTFFYDRWQTAITGDGTATFTPQTFTPGTAPVSGYEGKNYLRIVTASQTTAAVRTNFIQRIEDVRTLAGQNVVYSFWAKATTGTPSLAINFSQNFGSGGSAQADGTSQKVTLSTSWARYSITYAMPSVSGKTIGDSSYVVARIWVSAGSDFNASTDTLGIQNNTFEFWGVQLEAGSIATPFQTATGTLQGELAACQRYYYRMTPFSGVSRFGLINCDSTTQCEGLIYFPVTVRTIPTALEQSGTASDYSVRVAGSNITCSAVPTFLGATAYTATINLFVASGLVAGQTGTIRTANTNAYLAWSFEL